MKIDNLTLISSEGCNLNCSYCVVTKPQQKIINEEIKQAFKDGTYLNNIIQTFNNLSQDLSNITNITLWGQEPTLTMKELADFMPSLLKYCPNFNHFSFSTNGVDNIDNIIYLLSILSTIDFKSNLTIHIQFSHDGSYSTENLRGVSSEKIINNIKYFIKNLNVLSLSEKIRVDITFHGVLTRIIMKEFLNDETKILNYWLEWEKYLKEFNKINLNKQIFIKGWTPSIETPVNASKEEGELFAEFYRQSKKAFENNKIPNKIYNCLLDQFNHALIKPLFVDELLGKNYDNIIYKLANYEYDDRDYINSLSSGLFCGPFTHSLKIRYDGSLIHCQNVVHLLKEDNCNQSDEQEYLVAKSMLNHNHYPNIAKFGLTKDNKKIFDRLSLYKESGYPQLYSLIVNLMKILSDANQIDESYFNNDEKILRHAFYLSWFNNCLDNEFRTNASAVTKHLGFIRLLCNGFMDEYETHLYKVLPNVKKRQQKIYVDSVLKEAE